jgi:xanthine dehydrogenase accessory factor
MTHPTPPAALPPTILRLIESNRRFALATVLRTDGSTPVPAGAKAVIEADGSIHGTVGGGAVEAEAQQRAIEATQTGHPVLLEFDLHGPGPPEPSPICGGSMRLLVDPTAASRRIDYRHLADSLAQRARGLWITTLRSHPDLQVQARFLPESDLNREVGFPRPEVLATCLTTETPALVTSPQTPATEVFVDPILPRPVLLVAGGGHVGQAVAAQASLLGFEIVVIEDRPEFADPRRFPPGTKTQCGAVAHEVATAPVGPDTFVVIVTRGHQQDAAALRACIHRPAAYIGMIGSRRKIPLLRRQFLESGWATPEEFERVHAPIGLEIGAVTVAEIATSILAQIIAVRRKGAAPHSPPP